MTTHSSFSFQGQHGRLNVLKEFRSRGTGYWYAYHANSDQTRKRYLGGSETVTLVRLEEVAQDLQEVKQKFSPQPSHLPASSVSLNAAPAGKESLDSRVQQGNEINDPGSMLVMTRLSPPRLPATLVVRERLLAALDTALSRSLTLLSAAAGWGKTTLLATWAHRHPQVVAWLPFVVPNSYRNAYHLVYSWLRRLPDEVLQAQPELCFRSAHALIITTDRRSPATWARSGQLLQWAEQGFEAREQREQRGESLQLSSILAFLVGLP